MTCRRAQQQMAVALVGDLPRLERLEMEAHLGGCAACADALADLAATTVAVDRAYAPLRGASSRLSPARVRLAARAPLPQPSRPARLARLTTKLSEAALAAAVTAFAFVGASSVSPEPNIIGDEQPPETLPLTHVSQRLDDATFVRWMRLDRYVPPDDMVDPTAAIPEKAPEFTLDTRRVR